MRGLSAASSSTDVRVVLAQRLHFKHVKLSVHSFKLFLRSKSNESIEKTDDCEAYADHFRIHLRQVQVSQVELAVDRVRVRHLGPLEYLAVVGYLDAIEQLAAARAQDPALHLTRLVLEALQILAGRLPAHEEHLKSHGAR